MQLAPEGSLGGWYAKTSGRIADRAWLGRPRKIGQKEFSTKALEFFIQKFLRKIFSIFRTEIGPNFSPAVFIEADEQSMYKNILVYKFMGPQMEQQIKQKGR